MSIKEMRINSSVLKKDKELSMTSIIRILPLLLCSTIVMGAEKQSSNTKKQNESKKISLYDLEKNENLLLAYAKKGALHDEKVTSKIDDIKENVAAIKTQLNSSNSQFITSCGKNFLEIKELLQTIASSATTKPNSRNPETILIWDDAKNLDTQNCNFEKVTTLGQNFTSHNVAPAFKPQSRFDNQDNKQEIISNSSNKPSECGKSSSIFSLFSQNEKVDIIDSNDKNYLANMLEADPKKAITKIQRAKEATEERIQKHLEEQSLIIHKTFNIDDVTELGNVVRKQIMPTAEKIKNLLESGFLQYNTPALKEIHNYMEKVKAINFHYFYKAMTEIAKWLNLTQKIGNTASNEITTEGKPLPDVLNYDNLLLITALTLKMKDNHNK